MQEALTHQPTQGQGWPESKSSLHFVPWVSAVLSPVPCPLTLTHTQYSPLIHEHTTKKLLQK